MDTACLVVRYRSDSLLWCIACPASMLSLRPKLISAASFITSHPAIYTPRFPRSVLGAASNKLSLSQGVVRSQPYACMNAKPLNANHGTAARFCLNRSVNRAQVALSTRRLRDNSDCLVQVFSLGPPILYQSLLHKFTRRHKP